MTFKKGNAPGNETSLYARTDRGSLKGRKRIAKGFPGA